MPPKKTVTDSNVEERASDATVEERTDRKTAVLKPATHPSTVVMVKEALKALDSRSGVSSQAIKKYIVEKYPGVDAIRLNRLVRNVLVKGLENGMLVRPSKATVTAVGAVGKFKLAPKVKESKAKSENTDPNVQEGAEDEEKPKKSGATKKKTKSIKEKSPEDLTRPKKSKDEAAATSSKVPPAKKPKAKKSVEKDAGGGESKSAKPKATKTSPPSKAVKGGKAPASKAAGKQKKTVD